MKRRQSLLVALAALPIPASSKAAPLGKKEPTDTNNPKWEAVETMRYDMRDLGRTVEEASIAMGRIAEDIGYALRMIHGKDALSLAFYNIRDSTVNPNGVFGYFRLLSGKNRTEHRGNPPVRVVPFPMDRKPKKK